MQRIEFNWTGSLVMYFRWTILLWLDTWHAEVSSVTSRPLGFVRVCEPKTRSLCTEQKEFLHIIHTSYFLNLLLIFLALNSANTMHSVRFRGSRRSSRFAVFWDITPCELTYQHLRLNMQPQFFRAKDGFVLKKEAVGCYKIVVSIYQFARRHILQCREIDSTAFYLTSVVILPFHVRDTHMAKPVCGSHLWFHSNPPNLYRWSVNLWKPINIMEVKICIITLADVQFRM